MGLRAAATACTVAPRDRLCRIQVEPARRTRGSRRDRRPPGRLGAVHRVGHELRAGGVGPEGLPHHAAQRPHRGGPVLRRGQRVHLDLRPHARGQHGARRVLPAGRLHRAAHPAQHGRRGRRARAQQRPGRARTVAAAGRRRGRHRGRRRAAHAAVVPALEPGPGPAPGADHDRDLDHPRRPDARPLRGRGRGHLVAGDVRQVRQPARRGHPVHADADRHPRDRPRGRGRAVVLAQAHAHGHGDPRRRRRPRHGLRDGDQHPAHVRHRVHRRLGPGGPRRRDRRVVREPGAGRRRQLAAQLARRGDHRRHGVDRRRRHRRAPAGPDHQLRRRLPAGELHLLLDHLHLRPARHRARDPSPRALRPAGMKARIGGLTPDRAAAAVVVVLAVFAPLIFSQYWVATLLTQMWVLGVVAASLIYLSAFGGMVSLAQVAIYGVAGFALGNLTTNGNTKGLNLGWAQAPGIVLAIVVALVVACVFGALACRSYGIYFLMITLVFSVIANLFFGQVTTVSGFGGISGIPLPEWLSRTAHPDRLYFVTLVIAALVYATLRYVARTPFGLTLQGIRDDPVRMASLGYDVTRHRLLAFTFAGLIAAIGGILFVWWNAQIAPSTIGLGATIDVLVIAVIGGLYRLEGAWLGALVFVLLNNYAQDVSFIGDRFHTLIGLVFLVIVLVSPSGLMGLWQRAVAGRPRAERADSAEPAGPAGLKPAG